MAEYKEVRVTFTATSNLGSITWGSDMTRAEIVAALDAEVDKLDESMQLAWMRIRHLALSGETQDGICINIWAFADYHTGVHGSCLWHQKTQTLHGAPLDVVRDIAHFYSLHLGKDPNLWING